MWRTTVFTALMVATMASATASQNRLNGNEIRSAVAGKSIFLSAPLGGEFPLNYRTNGTVDGNGKAVGLGRFAQPKDSGKWWIAGDRLCQKWQEWYKGRQFCFELSRVNDSTLFWRRDDGLSGKARVAR